MSGERLSASRNWEEQVRSFEEKTGFSFARTSFQRLGGLKITPEMLILKQEAMGGILNAIGILRHLVLGNIVIDPFNPEQLGVNSYDVKLGENYYLSWETLRSADEAKISTLQVVLGPRGRFRDQQSFPLYNPQDGRNPSRMWRGPIQAITLNDFFKHLAVLNQSFGDLSNPQLYPQDSTRVIILYPGQTILCHTQEFIGGQHCIVPFMQARSSVGRSGLMVCEDAGLGNSGYISRWTMEVRNKSPQAAQILVVGNCYAQMAFFPTENLPAGVGYSGEYQKESDLAEIRENWRPEMMLPKTITPSNI